MKKITFLLTLLLLMIGGSKESAFAAADWGLSSSSLEAITANQTVVIKEAPSGLSGWSTNAYLNSGSSSVVSNVDYSCIYKFVENGTINQGGTDYQVYVLYNLATGKYLAGENSYTEDINSAFQMVPAHAVTATADEINAFTEWTDYYNKTSLNPSTQPETLWTLCKKDGKQWLNFVGNPGVQSYHDTNIWLIYAVTESMIPEARLASAKEAACAEVDALAQLTTLFSVDANALKTSINAVTLTDYNADAAVATINNLVRTAFNVNNKSITFSNLRNDERSGLHITAGSVDGTNVSKAFGTASTDNNKTVWTLKDNGDGTFKLYNVYSGLYLGTAASAGALSTDASAGANYTFVVRGTDQVSLKDHAGNILHQSVNGAPNYNLMSHNDVDNASNWTIVSVTIADEELIASYKANKAKLLNLAYPCFHDKYGLVKDADKISVVVIETEHAGDAKPVSNLLDGNLSTFVHSSYGSDKDDVTNHYIQVELSEAQQYIMFYMAKRNGNNRPATIKVYVSNDGTEFGTEPVATLENLHYLGDPYYSPSIDLGAAYKYVRFVVNSTNTNTKFFTATEFYVLPINDETAVLNAQNDVTTISQIAIDMQNSVLSTAELYAPTKEANALLTANASNHAAVPALGQYTTTAYNNLQTIVNGKPTLAELEAALNAFDKGQNRPVFLFTSANDGSYCNNGTIYDEGSSWRWMTKNYYDKRMFFTVKDLTATELTSGTAYNMYNYATGRSMFYDGTVTPEAVSGLDGVFNLKVNTGNGNLHCQAAGQSLVTWYPCVPLEAGGYDRMASAWRYEYVGNSYDFDQITDFPVSANELMGIQLNCTAANFGSGLGQYSGVNYSEVEAAKATVEALQTRENETRYSTTNTEITAAIAAVNASLAGATLNQPAPHKFYRFKSLSGNNKYLTSKLTNSRMTMNEADNTRESIFYLTEDNKLLSYKEGLFTKNFTSNNYNLEEAGHAGNAVVFAQGNPVTAASSCYHITCGDRSIYGKGATLDAGGNVSVDNTDTGYDWEIKEVEYLPIPVSNTYRFGTFTSPVDLAITDTWYSKDDRLKFYIAEVDPTDNYVVLTKVEENIPADQSYVIEYVAGSEYTNGCSFLKIADSAPAIQGTNQLRGSFKTIATPTDQGTIYTLQPAWDETTNDNNSEREVAFRQYNGTNIQGFRAYLPVPPGVQPAGMRFYEGNVTRIEGVEEGQTHKVDVYDLSGRRVQRATKGLYIVNGKKVLVK